ncbi:hypothetical protein PF005_g1743 [Phytophthora fragariae]|uniref:Secreted protein n=1 Tax=Phytophthora fragariae TaxID=53985 RepID=A0A6A3FTL2_9STRA|nr:hypothetical protein PF009_g2969 [Phytophthora fragariae]KAE8978458.1 hypothetical protein PF011_g23234 [Phytophthora fragariae]KAE9127540.1 hypothetical protein PF010_g4837 [Phytophthora fragariae]KAE9137090.1 hypothetical protein PF007_g1919 [Phytophthora fragariae]KAE9234823.1 hypothetical protein PF005_g1743 [Phytophthora fragariae]
MLGPLLVMSFGSLLPSGSVHSEHRATLCPGPVTRLLHQQISPRLCRAGTGDRTLYRTPTAVPRHRCSGHLGVLLRQVRSGAVVVRVRVVVRTRVCSVRPCFVGGVGAAPPCTSPVVLACPDSPLFV